MACSPRRASRPFPDSTSPSSRIFRSRAAVSGHTLLVYLAYLCVPCVSWTLYRHALGSQSAHDRRGRRRRARAPVPVDGSNSRPWCSAACSAASRAPSSLGYVSLFARQMNDERGLIALAAIFFAKGRPVRTAAVALLFGVADGACGSPAGGDRRRAAVAPDDPLSATILALIVVGVRATRDNAQGGGWRFDR